MTNETPYALRLRGLGFMRFYEKTFFEFEVDGVVVAPVGRVYARVESPDHLTVVQDENGFLYRIHELVPSQHLLGKDVSKKVTVADKANGTRRLRGRAYVPLLKSPVRSRSAALCSTRMYKRRRA